MAAAVEEEWESAMGTLSIVSGCAMLGWRKESARFECDRFGRLVGRAFFVALFCACGGLCGLLDLCHNTIIVLLLLCQPQAAGAIGAVPPARATGWPRKTYLVVWLRGMPAFVSTGRSINR